MDKMKRLEAILPHGRGVWIPIDHGASDFPNEGLHDLHSLIQALIDAKVDVILAHKGIVSKYAYLCQGTSTHMVIHYSVSTRHAGQHADHKVLVGSADETLSRGGIGVSCQVNLGSEYESEMIHDMGMLNRDAHLLGLPAFGMVYARGPHLKPVAGDLTNGQAHAVRLAFELGCDAAKTTWTGDEASFSLVAAAAPIPVLVAGGPASKNPIEVLTMVERALNAGANGVCMGRQVFAHPRPSQMAKALVHMVHHGMSSEQALEFLNE